MELKIGEIGSYKGKNVKCIKDKNPGKGCDQCTLFGNCREMKCSAKDRKDGQYTHFIDASHETGIETN